MRDGEINDGDWRQYFQKKQNAKLTGMDGPLLHGILGAVAIVEGDVGGDLFPQVVGVEPPVREEHRCWCQRWRRGGGIPFGTARGRAHGGENEVNFSYSRRRIKYVRNFSE